MFARDFSAFECSSIASNSFRGDTTPFFSSNGDFGGATDLDRDLVCKFGEVVADLDNEDFADFCLGTARDLAGLFRVWIIGGVDGINLKTAPWFYISLFSKCITKLGDDVILRTLYMPQ